MCFFPCGGNTLSDKLKAAQVNNCRAEQLWQNLNSSLAECRNFHKLSPNAQKRLAVENDDKESQYSITDLLWLHKKIGQCHAKELSCGATACARQQRRAIHQLAAGAPFCLSRRNIYCSHIWGLTRSVRSPHAVNRNAAWYKGSVPLSCMPDALHLILLLLQSLSVCWW